MNTYTLFFSDSTHAAEKDKSINAVKGDLEKKWSEERQQLQSRLQEVESELRRKEAALVSAVNDATCEGDQKVRERYIVELTSTAISFVSGLR